MSALVLLVVAFGFYFANAFLEDLQWRKDRKAGLTKKQSEEKARMEDWGPRGPF